MARESASWSAASLSSSEGARAGEAPASGKRGSNQARSRKLAAGLDDGEVAGPDLGDAREGGARCERAPEGEDLREPHGVDGPRHLVELEQGLRLGGEGEPPPRAHHVQRTDAEAVAREQEPPPPRVPEGEGELPLEALHAGVAEGLVGRDQHLRVGARPEPLPARLELGAELRVVVDLPVVRDPHVAGRAGEGLPPAGDVEDREPRVREPDVGVAVGAELVGAAVADGADHPAELLERGRWPVREVEDPGDAAHQTALPGAPASISISRTGSTTSGRSWR